jgi:hypothetical protein
MHWEERAQAELGREWPAVPACDAVNAPMIRHWREAMGFAPDWDEHAAAPQAMLQCWLFPGPSKARPPGAPLQDATAVQAIFAEGGYGDAVTVQAEMHFERALRPGDRLRYTSTLESIGAEKRTGLGPGRFLRYCFTVIDAQDACVGTLRFTNLVYRSPQGAAA